MKIENLSKDLDATELSAVRGGDNGNSSVGNVLQQMGVSVPASAILVKNTAAVLVTATLPPFAQPGMHIDVTTAALGDASNLQGGLLILTSLKAVDGQVYAVAQGPVRPVLAHGSKVT